VGWVLAVVSTLLLVACTTQALLPYSETMPPVVLATLAAAGVKDVRGHYRAAVCARLPAARPCDQVLVRLPGETPARAPVPPPDLAQRYRLVFVPGLLADCVERLVQSFADVMDSLRQAGFAVHYVQGAGRGASAANAQQLARQLAALGEDPRPLLVFAYSKGLPDMLEMLVHAPAMSPQIAAIVSLVGGSPLVDNLHGLYRTWLVPLPLPGCAPGTGEELRDLQRETRLAWWAQYRPAVRVPVFSLVALPRPERVSPALTALHAELGAVDPRNDGQLLWYDAVVVPGWLLGYVNADHWALALPLHQQLPALAFLFRDDVPRLALIEAAMEVVDGILRAASGQKPQRWCYPHALLRRCGRGSCLYP